MRDWVIILMAVVTGTTDAHGARPAEAAGLLPQWQYFQEVPLPAEARDTADASKWCDFVLTRSVFDQARLDLGDLRLYDAAGTEVPYALRVRRAVDSRAEVAARQFNRAVGPEQTSELTLDLGAEPPEHNEVEISTPGINFRRPVQLEASADGQAWNKLRDKNLVNFRTDGKVLEDSRLDYSPSRFRYLRLRVFRDLVVDKKSVEIGKVTVLRTVEVPGELVTLPARLGPREPVRTNANPGSAWILDLGAAHVPCEKLLVDIGDAEFARDYTIEADNATGSDQGFLPITGGAWSRHAGEARKPLEAIFGEQQAGRLKLVVTDFRNPPLDVRAVQFVAPAREIVFQHKASLIGPLRLFYANPNAEPPHYDLERNLPAQLSPPAVRLSLADRHTNPDYAPPPKPLSQRWPWAIYVVLGAASIVLACILVSLGRAAVALNHAGHPDEPMPAQ